MNLTVRIHDTEYTQEVAQGVTFSEEYNETLDSGSIRLSHIFGQLENLRPYDDVYIYESGYVYDEYAPYWRQGGTLHDGDKDENGRPYDANNSNARRIPFYRHLLVDNYAEEIVNLDAVDPITDKSGIFSYSIELFSETKGLEMVQLPHISVTQPLNMEKKVDIYTYLTRFVNMYSPKYKTVDRSSTSETKKWKYTKKYSVAPELKEIFGGVYPQDFTLSNPTLKDVLSTLMITKDMIPYVKDNVIYAKAISERTGTYNIQTEKDSGRINMVVSQMSSNDYCDGVRRQYSNALSQDGTCHFIEHLGFRNKNSAIMTLDNMQLETTHSIYKVKKLHMCYYKKINIEIVTEEGTTSNEMWFLCKQDMTPLVKLNSEWELLSQDWRELLENGPQTIYDLSNYKISTVTYDLGGNSIRGWGTRYNKSNISSADDVALTAYDITKTYIENIFAYVEKLHPLGIKSVYDVQEYYKNKFAPNVDISSIKIKPIDISFPEEDNTSDILDHVYAANGMTSTLKFKTFFFEIEYEGFYDGALIHSRDKGNDNLFQNDNQSSALTLLEKDGYSQKEKLNRFANKTITMKGRLDGDNYGVENLLKLGQTGVIGQDDDVIIYRREYSIFDNYILVSYAGVNDYVLKNFYTSVYARYRTNQLMSYNESTTRAETRKIMLLLSKDKKFKDEEDTFLKIENNGVDVTNKVLFSAFEPNQENQENQSINCALINNPNGTYSNYFVDLQTFTSGNSLCFNVAMTDNASGGNYIESWTSPYELLYKQPSEDADYYAGSTQQWINIVDDTETGYIEDMNFLMGHGEEGEQILIKSDEDAIESIQKVYDRSTYLPLDMSLKNDEDLQLKFSYNWGTHSLRIVKNGDNDTYEDSREAGENFIQKLKDREIEQNTNVPFRVSIQIPGEYGMFSFVSTFIRYEEDNDQYSDAPHTITLLGSGEDASGQVTEPAKFYVRVAGGYYSEDLNSGTVGGFSFIKKTVKPENVGPFVGYGLKQDRAPSYPILTQNNIISINGQGIYKDNKEKIDMTAQIEPISMSPDSVILSEYFVKLSNLISQNKYAYDYVFSNYYETIDEGITPITFTYNHDRHQLEITNDDAETLITALEDNKTTKTRFNVVINVPGQYRDFNFVAEEIEYEKNETPYYIPYKITLRGFGGTSLKDVSELKFFPRNLDESGKIYSCLLKGIFYKKILEPEGVGPFVGNAITISSNTDEKNIETIYKNMFVEFSNNTINRTSIPSDIPYKDEPIFIKNSQIPSSIFKLEYGVGNDGTKANEAYIRVLLKDGDYYLEGINADTKSIRYWYFDFDDAYHKNYTQNYTINEKRYIYTPEKSQYRFVFGVNLTEEDHDRGYVDIYITKTTHRDERVFDSVGRQVGIVHNCVDDRDENGEWEAPSYQGYDEHLGDELAKYSVNVEIEPENSGKVVGNGFYYNGEIANLTFTPNDGTIFYRWNKGDGDFDSNNSLAIIVDGNKTLVAQCGVKYRFWDSGLDFGSRQSNNTVVALYTFDNDQIINAETVLEISANISISGSILLALPFVYVGSFSINTMENTDEDTASKATIVGDFGSVTLNVWFDNGTIYATGYRTFLSRIYPINIDVLTLDAILTNKPQITHLELDFWNSDITSISVRNITKNTTEEYTSSTTLTDNNYEDEMEIWATTSSGYATEYTVDNPLKFKMGMDMRFAPSVTEIKFSGPSIEERGNGYYGWYSINEGADQWGAYVENKNDFEVICEAVWDDGLMEHQTVETIIANSTKPIVLQARLNETLLQGRVYAKFRFVKDDIATDWTDRLLIAD